VCPHTSAPSHSPPKHRTPESRGGTLPIALTAIACVVNPFWQARMPARVRRPRTRRTLRTPHAAAAAATRSEAVSAPAASHGMAAMARLLAAMAMTPPPQATTARRARSPRSRWQRLWCRPSKLWHRRRPSPPSTRCWWAGWPRWASACCLGSHRRVRRNSAPGRPRRPRSRHGYGARLRLPARRPCHRQRHRRHHQHHHLRDHQGRTRAHQRPAPTSSRSRDHRPSRWRWRRPDQSWRRRWRR
jgi:hypothetical protein